MRDMKEGINKAIDSYEEHGVYVELTVREKELIEYGYIQCALHVGYDMVTKGENFIMGLQELIFENDDLKKKLENSSLCEEFIEMVEYDGEPVPKELCSIDREGEADDFHGCGACFECEGHMQCDECVIDKMFKHYTKLTGQGIS